MNKRIGARNSRRPENLPEHHGHRFQNRYKSILCQEDRYLLELVRYIRLNPLRAKLAADYESLQGFRCARGT